MIVNLYILALDSKGLLVDLEVLSKALNEISISVIGICQSKHLSFIARI